MRTGMTLRAAALATVVVLVSGGVAWASPPGTGASAGPVVAAANALPDGWEITGSKAGPRLVWSAPEPVPVGDAAVEFYAAGRLLGRPLASEDQRLFQLDLTGVRGRELTDLEVRAGGRRLDDAQAGRDAQVPPGVPTRVRAPAALPENPVDPGRPGGFEPITGEYNLPSVALPELLAPVEMRAVVVAPKGARGPRPLVLFLHGRHATCYDPDGELEMNAEWPCVRGLRPIPSYRGYLQMQRLLASQGYVTVSISANGVNGQDALAVDGGAQSRSSLVRQHLSRWADWADAGRAGAPPIVRSAPPVDLSKVLLMGHSRGGEGVNRAAMDSLSPPPNSRDGYRGRVRWKIRGTVLIGPTIFGHNPVPDVPSVTVLPGCDGDVYDLQGQIYADGTRGVSRGAALHSVLYFIGANHNYFNAEWTPGQAQAPAWDDFFSDVFDPVCTPGTAAQPSLRLTAAQQQTAGASYVAAAAALFLRDDDRVRPLLDGSGARAPSADPARVLSHAVGAARRPLLTPDAATTVTGAEARVCQQVHADPDVACLTQPTGISPHFVAFNWVYPEVGRYAVMAKWAEPGAAVRLRLAEPASITGTTALALRMIVPPNSTDTRLDVAVTDDAGRRAVVGQARLDGLPATRAVTAHWAQEVRLPLTPAVRAAVDLNRLTELELVPRGGEGQAWLLDAWGWRAGTPAPRPTELPRVDLGEMTVREGDSGTRTYRIPVRLSGRGKGQVRLFLVDPVNTDITERVVEVGRDTRTIDIPVTVQGNTRYSDGGYQWVAAKAVEGTLIGDYDGGLIVENDDPLPDISLRAVADRVSEGGTLSWEMALSESADSDIWVGFPARAPSGAVELSSTDVHPSWFEQWAVGDPLPSRPLSEVGAEMWGIVAAGELSTELTVPTVADELAEPEEQLLLQMLTYPSNTTDPVPGVKVLGTVVDDH